MKLSAKINAFSLCAGLVLLCLTLPARAAEVSVFAAASLTDALQRLAPAYEKESGDKLVFNFGASSLLERQIEEGAPADVFFSADEARMDALEKKGLVLSGSRKSCLSNSLVIVMASDSQLKLATPEELAGPAIKRLALADPKAVPAGVYAKAFLQKRQLWTAVEAKVVPAGNVRAALAAVESGDVEAGIVYKTDAAISKKVRVACEIPTSEGPAISYPVAVVKESRNPAAARRFADYLGSPAAMRVFESYGFRSLAPGQSPP